ncbi:hypothetical protein JB92DRAFT_2827832 [Gautieria morchelliformis]|nr:hypothetical protein JB92DRAFT_2827832 [Gautieria morchelliformis]
MSTHHKYLTPSPYIFLPFNAGPRICLGQQTRLPIIAAHAILPALPPPSMSTMGRWLTSRPASPPPLPVREPLIDDHRPLVRVQRSRPVAVDFLVSPELEVDTDTASVKTPTVAQFAHVLAGGEGEPHMFHDESPTAPAPRIPQSSTCWK